MGSRCVEPGAYRLAVAPGVELWTDEVPTPLDASGIDQVPADRLRPTIGRPSGVSVWIVGDNLRKGAVLNAVQIAEIVVG